MKYKIRFKAQDDKRKYVDKNFSSSEYLSVEKYNIPVDIHVSNDMSEVYFRYPDFKDDRWFIPTVGWSKSKKHDKTYLHARAHLARINGQDVKMFITVDRFFVALYGDRKGNKNIDYKNLDKEKEFHVHHIDDDTHNNSIDNLLILTPNEHSFFAAPARAKYYSKGEVTDWEIVNLQKIIRKYKLEDLYPKELLLMISKVNYKPSKVYPVTRSGITCYFWCDENGEKGQWSFDKKEWYNVTATTSDNLPQFAIARLVEEQPISFSATIKFMVVLLHGDMFGTKYSSLQGAIIGFKDNNPNHVRKDNLYVVLVKNPESHQYPTEDTYFKIKNNSDKLLKAGLIKKPIKTLLIHEDPERLSKMQANWSATVIPPEQIIKEYEEGDTVEDIAKRHSMKTDTVRYYLRTRNVEIRKPPKYELEDVINDYQNGMSYLELEQKYKRTSEHIKRILRNSGIELRKEYNRRTEENK